MPFEVSETSKYRHLTVPHCRGNGVDIGCGGDPVVPSSIRFDLPPAEYAKYHSGNPPEFDIHYGGDATSLPFKDGTLDYVYSSHLLEDFADWEPIVREWLRVIKPGGRLVILIPDKELWAEALRRGQPPNCAHRHEGTVGELTDLIHRLGGARALEERRTECFPGDYSILFIAQRL